MPQSGQPISVALVDDYGHGRRSTCTPSHGLHLERSPEPHRQRAPTRSARVSIEDIARHGSWSPCRRLCIPARWSSTTFRHAGAAPRALIGPGGAKVSAIAKTMPAAEPKPSSGCQTRLHSRPEPHRTLARQLRSINMSPDDTRQDLPSVPLIDRDAGPWSRVRRARMT
jgi:hypothetical protein